MRNNKVPKMDPCGTPALTVFQDDSFPFITTICFLLVKYYLKHKSKFPTIPIFFNLKRRPLCHTLSKALLISKKITLISFPSSRALLNIFAIYRS